MQKTYILFIQRMWQLHELIFELTRKRALEHLPFRITQFCNKFLQYIQRILLLTAYSNTNPTNAR